MNNGVIGLGSMRPFGRKCATLTTCERGFTIETYDAPNDRRKVWAFDRIEDAAQWLCDNFGERAND